MRNFFLYPALLLALGFAGVSIWRWIAASSTEINNYDLLPIDAWAKIERIVPQSNGISFEASVTSLVNSIPAANSPTVGVSNPEINGLLACLGDTVVKGNGCRMLEAVRNGTQIALRALHFNSGAIAAFPFSVGLSFGAQGYVSWNAVCQVLSETSAVCSAASQEVIRSAMVLTERVNEAAMEYLDSSASEDAAGTTGAPALLYFILAGLTVLMAGFLLKRILGNAQDVTTPSPDLESQNRSTSLPFHATSAAMSELPSKTCTLF